MKLCKTCGNQKPTVAFNKDTRMADGLFYQCRDCQKAYYAKYISDPDKKLIKKQWRKKYLENSENIQKLKEYYLEYTARPDVIKSRRKYMKEYRKTNALQIKDTYYKKNYGLTRTEALSLLESQNNKCSICESGILLSKSHIDHDHKTGKVRGILCNNCNWGLGNFKDSRVLLNHAALYLSRTTAM